MSCEQGTGWILAPPRPLAGHHGAQHTHTVLCIPTPTKMPCRVTGTNTFCSITLASGAHGSSSSRLFASSKRKRGWENYGDCGCSADGRHGRQEPSQPAARRSLQRCWSRECGAGLPLEGLSATPFPLFPLCSLPVLTF